MQEQQQPKGWTPIEDARKAATFGVFALQVLASPIEPFLRTRFGAKYFGAPSAVALLGLPMWMVFFPGDDPRPLIVFWVLYIVMQLRARMESARMVARGEHIHTRYNGWPRLAGVFKKMPERSIKVGAETVVVCVSGVLLLPLSEALGSYLLVAGLASGLLGSIMEAADRAKTMELNDAWIEQEAMAERFRRMREGR